MDSMTGMSPKPDTYKNPPPLSSSLLEAVLPRESLLPLNLPMSLVLNTTGLSVLKGTGGEKGLSGQELPMSIYKPDVVRKLIMKDCIKRIDIRLDDVISRRRDILDTGKLLFFTVMYKQFRRDLIQKTVNTSLIKQWNRQHPRQKMDASSDASMAWVVKSLSSRTEELALFRRNLLIRLWKEHYDLFQDDEQHKKMGLAEKLIREMHPLTKYILLAYGKIDEVKQLQQDVIDHISLYIRRFDLPEFNSLVLLEYLQCSERENLINLYSRILEQGGKKSTDYPMNDQIRSELIKRKISPETRFSFMFEKKNSTSRGMINRIRTIVVSGEKESREINEILFHRDNSKLDKQKIKDYMEEDGKCDDNYNPEILYYYLSHLEDACRETGCSFSSFVNCGSDSRLSMTHLVFDS
ncbi:MAG: hypothetical protein PQJ58_07130 [Spirochaetales bacterium]|nr:hypothetical protein [Spirochaetales bacterium]